MIVLIGNAARMTVVSVKNENYPVGSSNDSENHSSGPVRNCEEGYVLNRDQEDLTRISTSANASDDYGLVLVFSFVGEMIDKRIFPQNFP